MKILNDLRHIIYAVTATWLTRHNYVTCLDENPKVIVQILRDHLNSLDNEHETLRPV